MSSTVLWYGTRAYLEYSTLVQYSCISWVQYFGTVLVHILSTILWYGTRAYLEYSTLVRLYSHQPCSIEINTQCWHLQYTTHYSQELHKMSLYLCKFIICCSQSGYSRTPVERPPSPTTIPLIRPYFVWRCWSNAAYLNPSRATIPLIWPHQCDSEGGRIRGVLLYILMNCVHTFTCRLYLEYSFLPCIATIIFYRFFS